MEAAQRLWARASSGATTPAEVAAAVEHMCDLLSSGLGRWIGVAGYRALLRRAVGITVKEYPGVGGFACLGGASPVTPGREAVTGVTTLVATLIELLGVIIGEDMAVRLVEQAGMPGPRLVVNDEPKRGRNA